MYFYVLAKVRPEPDPVARDMVLIHNAPFESKPTKWEFINKGALLRSIVFGTIDYVFYEDDQQNLSQLYKDYMEQQDVLEANHQDGAWKLEIWQIGMGFQAEQNSTEQILGIAERCRKAELLTQMSEFDKRLF